MRKFFEKFLFYVVGVPLVMVWGLWLIVTGKVKVNWKREFIKASPFLLVYTLGLFTIQIVKAVVYYYGLR